MQPALGLAPVGYDQLGGGRRRGRAQIRDKDAEVQGLTSSIASTQQENDRLQNSIDALDTPEGLEQVARDQLGMVSEGEIVFEDVGN